MTRTWKELFALHVEDMAIQHERISALLQSLSNNITAKLPPREVEGEFERLIQYLKVHFGDEEEFMAAGGYPGLDSHVREHEGILQNLALILVRVSGGTRTVAPSFDELAMALGRHLRETDSRYLQYFRELQSHSS